MNAADLSDAEINRQFMPRLAVPDHESWLAAHAGTERDRAAYPPLPPRHSLWRATPLQKLDVFPAARAPAPVQVYLPRRLLARPRQEHRTASSRFLDGAGGHRRPSSSTTISAPPSRSTTSSARPSPAVAWVYRHGADHGCDPQRLYVSGNSAGAHLAAMALAQDWRAQGLPADLIKGACCITGIYDIAPVLRIDANAEIRLTPDMVARNSPAHAAAAGEAAGDRRRRRRRDAALDQAVDRLRRHAARPRRSRPS